MKSENGKKYALIAGVCYAIYVLYIISNEIRNIQEFDYHLTALDVIFWIVTIGMAVTLFLKNEKAVIVAAGANVLYYVYNLISHNLVWILFYVVAYVALIVLLVLTIKRNNVVKNIWFIPGAAALISTLIMWLSYQYFSYFIFLWKSMVFNIIEIAALVFVGIWLRKSVVPAMTESVSKYATFNSQAVSSVPASGEIIGGADKLKMYKELLDSGTITQEEFDAKKKQILGL